MRRRVSPVLPVIAGCGWKTSTPTSQSACPVCAATFVPGQQDEPLDAVLVEEAPPPRSRPGPAGPTDAPAPG